MEMSKKEKHTCFRRGSSVSVPCQDNLKFPYEKKGIQKIQRKEEVVLGMS